MGKNSRSECGLEEGGRKLSAIVSIQPVDACGGFPDKGAPGGNRPHIREIQQPDPT